MSSLVETNRVSADGVRAGIERSLVRRLTLKRPVAQFAASGLAAVLLLGGGAVLLMRHIGTSEAIRDAKQLAQVTGHGIVEPNVDGLVAGDPRAIARVDRAVRSRVLNDRVVRVKIWTPDGRIVYSDRKALTGQRYALGDDELDAIRAGGVFADVSDLTRPENRFERRFHKLLEVYLPIHDGDGHPLLYETYQRFSSVSASGRRLLLAFGPAALGGLVVLWLVQLPLAWGLARRLREGQAERVALLRRAVDASERERRRVARDLHDGAVQDLAGVSYSLAAVADRLPPGEAAGAVHAAAADTRRTIRELRSLLVDLYPPDLHRAGLEAALADLLAPLGKRGVDARLELPAPLRLPPGIEALFYRSAQEALRNVVAHSGARRVALSVLQENGTATLAIADDGRGFDPADRPAGHFGLQLLDDLARDSGGRLAVESTPGHGTRVRVEVPVA